MAKRQVFFSFEYKKDNWRASKVREMGKFDDKSTFSDNDWEEVKSKSNKDIETWINNQMEMRSCLVVLIGSTTSERKWVKYEINKAYELGKGIVGIYIHNLKDSDGNQTKKGKNPFDYCYDNNNNPLSDNVKCFDSGYKISTNVYSDIENHIEDLIEDAIERRGTY